MRPRRGFRFQCCIDFETRMYIQFSPLHRLSIFSEAVVVFQSTPAAARNSSQFSKTVESTFLFLLVLYKTGMLPRFGIRHGFRQRFRNCRCRIFLNLKRSRFLIEFLLFEIQRLEREHWILRRKFGIQVTFLYSFLFRSGYIVQYLPFSFFFSLRISRLFRFADFFLF